MPLDPSTKASDATTSRPLDGQTALVTGSSRGIGRAIARRLAADGAHVFVHYNSSSNSAEALVGEIEEAGGSAETIAADLADVSSVDRLVTEVKERLGDRKLDILVNNAAIAELVGFTETDAETLDRHLAVNVRAPFQLTAGLADQLASGGRVLFTSSVVAKSFFPGAPGYAITKGAIDTLTRHLAATLGERGIRVNAIAPGLIETDMSEPWLSQPEVKTQITSLQALSRIGQPDDIAGVAGFLAGPDSAWVTGQVIDVSGGTKL
jgi:NAD(P)-dependent dehydrogenase (short-subunit alcohol dehydrogenase family)